jgi:hypothetical protein
VAHWQWELQTGSRLEPLLAEVCEAEAPQQGRHLEKQMRRLRKTLLADIEAMVAI